jgi:hypothetical protein
LIARVVRVELLAADLQVEKVPQALFEGEVGARVGGVAV